MDYSEWGCQEQQLSQDSRCTIHDSKAFISPANVRSPLCLQDAFAALDAERPELEAIRTGA